LLYRELAMHLQPDQPIYGLQCKGVDGHTKSHERIEDMASDYVAEILAAYPRGSIIVGGYCMGGVVALEMAQQLASKGLTIALVMAIESYHYRQCGVKPSPLLACYHYLQNIWFHTLNIILAGRRRSHGFLAKKLLVEMSRAMAAMKLIRHRLARHLYLTAKADLPHVALSRINDEAYFVYEPKPYAGKVVVFRPKRQFMGYDKNDCGWGAIAPGKVEVEVLPVNPRGMLVEPFVEDLACRMRRAIDNAFEQNAIVVC
jgi:thioesterase domain-containing protein